MTRRQVLKSFLGAIALSVTPLTTPAALCFDVDDFIWQLENFPDSSLAHHDLFPSSPEETSYDHDPRYWEGGCR